MKTLKKVLACMLCATMMLAGNVCGTAAAVETESSTELDVRAMSFNVRYLLDDSYDAITYTAAQRKKVVLDQIKAYAPDLLGVQEDTAEWKTVLTEGLSGYSVYAGAVSGDADDSSYGAVFYKTDRFTRIEAGCKWLTSTPDTKSKLNDSTHYRRVTYVILQDKLTNAQFCFANTHLHNGMEAPAQIVRAQQAEYLMNILDDVIGDRNLPVILVGDFNGGTATDTLVDVIVANGLFDARNIADVVEADVNATWNSGYGNPANYGAKSRIMDHCFVSAGVPVAKFRVATEKYPDADGNMICTSDHFPLVVEISSATPIDSDLSWHDENATEYRIYDAADLLGFAELLKNGTTFDGKTVYLCNDIVLNEGNAADWATNDPTNAYMDCSSATYFKGTFDGQGYVISGLYVNNSIPNNATALIPYAGDDAIIRNVTVVNSYFQGGRYVSAVVGTYKPTSDNDCLTIKNVHVEDTVITSDNHDTAGILGYLHSFDNAGVRVVMEDVSFVGGSITANRHSGGIIGRIYGSSTYENGVALTMNRIVLDTDLTFSTTSSTLKSGSLIGNLNGFRTVDASNVFIGGTLTVEGTNANSAALIGIIAKAAGNVSSEGTLSQVNVSDTLIAQKCTNVESVLFSRDYQQEDYPDTSAEDHFVNVYHDSDVDSNGKLGCTNRKTLDGSVPASAKSFKDLKGTQAGYDGWMAVANDYPVPTARPARLLGYQSSYATDVKDVNDANETYSVRLIAALNDTFYTYAGFENITITYTDGEGNPVAVPKEDYRCKYAYNNVLGVDKNGNKQTYAASDYYAEHLIALEITGIPESVTAFTITLNVFAGKDGVSFAGISRAVSVVAVS